MTLAGTSRTWNPSIRGWAWWEPPTTAMPVGLNKRRKSFRSRVGELTARQTIRSAVSCHSLNCLVTTRTLGRPSTRTARRARSARRVERSSRVTSLLGHAIASGNPGKPTPEPTSSKARGGAVARSHAEANKRESARCRENRTGSSEGPMPPAGKASSMSHRVRLSKRRHCWWSTCNPAHWAAPARRG